MSGVINKKSKILSASLRRLLITSGILLLISQIRAQDVHFTMYNSCPLLLNPANTGVFIGDWRVGINFRNQWGAIDPFNTEMVSYDSKLYLFNQDFGAGAYVIFDQAGSSSLNTVRVFGSLRYSREINKNFVNLGIQLGYVHQRLGGNQTYPDQYNRDNGNFNPDLPSNEPYAGEKHAYLDVNMGLSWKKSINLFEPELGISIFHLNSPNQSFFGGVDKLPLRFVINSNVKTKLSDEFYVTPSILYNRQKEATETMIGTNLGMNVLGNKSTVKEIFAGIYLRNGIFDKSDAVCVLAGTSIRRLEIALSYDITMSHLKTVTNNRSAFEISIIYRSISTVLNSYSIPCERY
jgi:type IX secretion system PorP/SprF family membrane protein